MIGHVDADCFYVSAERARFPHLERLPVGVLGNHGACIIAKSYEMKASGVTTGMPIWDAVPICPDGVYIKRDFRWYEVLSRKMLGLVKERSPQVEFYSIDESFFAAEAVTLESARELQQAIKADAGVPVSVGIAQTKTLAKLISSSVKPYGFGVVTNDDERERLLEGLPVEKVTGIARRSAEKLSRSGITTCDQLAAANRALIRRLLTKTGEELWWELNGHPVKPITVARPEHQFVSRGGSIGRATNNPTRVSAFVVRNTERLIEALDHYHLACEQLSLELSFRDAPGCGQRVSLGGGRSELDQLREAALWLLPRVWRPETAFVHYMHVIAGKLTDRGRRQRSLFETPTKRLDAVNRVQHDINETVGRFSLRSGSTLPLADVHRDPANDYDICDVYGKSCF